MAENAQRREARGKSTPPIFSRIFTPEILYIIHIIFAIHRV